MAHELIDSVTVDPAGPLTIVLGGEFDLTASYSLNGPPTGSPTASVYQLIWQRISPGAPVGLSPAEVDAVAGVEYTHTVPASVMSVIGDYIFRVQGTVQYTPFDEQYVDSADVVVHVVAAPHYRDIEAEATERTAIAGVESRSVEATLPDRNVVAGAKEI